MVGRIAGNRSRTVPAGRAGGGEAGSMSENPQQREPDQVSGRPARREGEAEPDVLLDVPEVSVDSIRLAVDGLDADLSLRARLANLLELDAGVRVRLQGVELDITGVHAEAQLKVRLEKVVDILDRALTTIDRNPHIIDALSGTATPSVDDVNRATQQAANLTGQITASAERSGGPAPAERLGGATDDLGQQVGAIGAVADRLPREPSAPGQDGKPGGPDQGGKPGGGGPGAGPAPRGGGLASGSGGGGEQGQAQRAREQAAREAGSPEQAQREQGGPEQAREERGGPERERGPAEQARPEQGGPDRQPREQGGGPAPAEKPGGGARQGGEGRRPEAGQREPSEDRPGGGPGTRPDDAAGAPPSATQLAEQAGETLRQAGRSVWEAIQSGIAQHRQQGR